MLVDILHAKLEGGDRSGRKRLFEARRKIAPDIERGNKIELAGSVWSCRS
jgi:hypothetical protein